MHFNWKTSVVLAAVSFSILTTPACTKQSRDGEKPIGVAQNISGGANVAYAAETDQAAKPKVLNIKTIKKGDKGKAQDFTWEENGKTISFLEYTKNKVVFLNFWGTWCGPCRMEIPDIVKLDKDLSSKNFVVIGIALERDMSSAISNVTKFAESKGIKYMNFIGNADIANAYGGITGVPTTFIIDKSGNINETIVGARSYNMFKQSIDRVLK